MIRSKTDVIQASIDRLFSKDSALNRRPSIEGLGARPGFKPTNTRFEARADETTRLVREITDAAAEQRQAKTSVLRAARLQKEAEDQAAAALTLVEKPTRSRKTARVETN